VKIDNFFNFKIGRLPMKIAKPLGKHRGLLKFFFEILKRAVTHENRSISGKYGNLLKFFFGI
jgi:hypothetical protein